MQKKHARDVSRILATYAKDPLDDFRVERVRGERPLEGFHKWADRKPHVATDRVERDDGTVLYVLLIDWRDSGEYYVVLYPKDRSNPQAELWSLDDAKAVPTLSWTYTPKKRDGINAKRVAYFQKYIGAPQIHVALPRDSRDAPRFLKDLFDLVDNRVRADALDGTTPEARTEFPEGAEVERLHKARERSSALVALVKRDALARHGRLECFVCAFDFEAIYGAPGDGFIEAHHTRPLSELTSETKTRPEELVLVCSNCHRMLHRRRPWLGARDLSKILRR